VIEGEAVTVGEVVGFCERDGIIDIDGWLLGEDVGLLVGGCVGASVVGLDDVVGWDVVGSELGISEGV